jgi:hypothetical protein
VPGVLFGPPAIGTPRSVCRHAQLPFRRGRYWCTRARWEAEVSENFYGIWVPRIGREAAEILKRRSALALIPVGFIVGIVLVALTLHGVGYALAAGALVVTTLTMYLYLTPRFNRQLAIALSKHLGCEVNPRRLPQFRRATRFDAWLRAMQTGMPPRERSYFGGFVKVQLPPK